MLAPHSPCKPGLAKPGRRDYLKLFLLSIVGQFLYQLCWMGGLARTSVANVLFKDAPVQGEDPDVRFVVTAEAARPCCLHLVGTGFVGRLDGTGDIVGSYAGTDIRFKRAATGTWGGA